MKKIAIFHQEFYFSGGAERLIFEEIDSLRKSGYSVEVWAPLVDRNHCFPDQIKKYPVYSFFPYIRFFPREAIILLSLVMAPIFAWRFKDIDLFYGENQAGPYFAFLMAKIWKKPYIVFMPYPVGLLYPRQIDKQSGLLVELPWYLRFIMQLFSPLIRIIDRKIIHGAHSFLTTGSYASSLFTKIYGREVLNAPSGAIALSAKEINARQWWKGTVSLSGSVVSKPYILLTNRPMPKKKFEYMIDSLPYIRKTFPNITVAIAGEINDYIRSLQVRAKALRVEECVQYLGFLDGDALAKAYKHAAVYVYTAPEEDYGKGMVEAMANGVPVVAWSFAGPTGIVENRKSGYLARPFEVLDMAKKIVLLLENRERNERMGRYGWELVRSRFTPRHHEMILQFAIEDCLKKSVFNN